MYELRSRDELERALRANELVIVLYYGERGPEQDTMMETLRRLEESADPRVLFCSVNVLEHPELVEGVDRVPHLKLYHNGEVVFEQVGSLTSAELNLFALRRGMRSVLAARNVNIRI